MLYDILQSPHQLVVRGNTVAQNHSSGIYSESGYLNYYVENTIYKNEKRGHVPGLRLLRQLHYRM